MESILKCLIRDAQALGRGFEPVHQSAKIALGTSVKLNHKKSEGKIVPLDFHLQARNESAKMEDGNSFLYTAPLLNSLESL